MLRQTEFKGIRTLRLPFKFALGQREMAPYERFKLLIKRLWLENLILIFGWRIACDNLRKRTFLFAHRCWKTSQAARSEKKRLFSQATLMIGGAYLYPFSSLEIQGETESPLLTSGSWSLVCSRGPCIPCESSGHFPGPEARTPESIRLYGATNPI